MVSALLLCLILQDEIGSLVDRLGSDRVEDREEAEARLKELGPATIPALEPAAASGDEELAIRARSVLRIQRIRMRFTPAVRRDFPAAESRILQRGEGEWATLFLEIAVGPGMTREDLEPLLLPALQTGDPRLRDRVLPEAARLGCRSSLVAILRAGEGLGCTVMDSSPLLPWLDGLETRPDGSDLVELLSEKPLRSAALILLHRRPYPGIRSALLGALRDPDPETREASLALVGFQDAGTEAVWVADRLADPEGRLRSLAITILDRWNLRAYSARIGRLLTDPDPRVRLQAASAVRRLEAREHLEGVVARLKDENREVVLQALTTLTQWRSREAASSVRPFLQSPDPYLHEAAIQYVLCMADREAAPVLVPLARSKEPSVRRRAVEALGDLGALDQAPAIEVFLGDPAPSVRAAAVSALLRIRYLPSIDLLLGLLRDKEPEVFAAAAGALGAMGNPTAIPELARVMRSPDGFRRSIAGEALLALGVRAEDLASELKEASLESRLDILRLLEATHQPEAIPVLIAELEHPEWEASVTAIRALAHLDARSAAPRIAEFLSDEGGECRREAIRALGSLRAREAIPALSRALVDRDPEARVRAATALGRIGDAEAIPALREALGDDEIAVRFAAAEALGPALGDDPIEELLPALDREGPPVVISTEVARRICLLGSERGIEPLLDGAVQAMASLFPLNRLRQPVVFDRLQGLPVSGSPDPSAFKAILALAAQAGLEVIDESEGVFESELRPPPCCYRDGGAATVAEAIEVLLFQGPCEAILEAGQLHILKREDALGFWRAWNQGG